MQQWSTRNCYSFTSLVLVVLVVVVVVVVALCHSSDGFPLSKGCCSGLYGTSLGELDRGYM